jgi:DNA-binding response OmpR family regulator
MATARLIVFETSGQWSSALRHGLEEQGVTVSQVASLEACRAMLEQHPGSLAAVELSISNVESALSALRDLQQDSPACGVMMLAERGLESIELLLLEAGAVCVATSRRNLGSVAKLVQRCWRSAEPPAANFHEETWRRMPWGSC